MDTPQRNQIGTPLSKFEDSPVFNYINNLSPIEPVKSRNISQTFNLLSFAAIPSVFTSPHVKEFRFLRRHQFSDQSNFRNSPDNGNRPDSNGVTDASLHLSGNSAVPAGSSLGEASFDSHNEHPELAVKLSKSLKFDGGSRDSDSKCCSSGGRDGVPELTSPTASPIPSIQEAFEEVTLQDGVHLQDIRETEQNREESGCEWESLISDSPNLLIFSSPDGNETFKRLQRSIDPGASCYTSLVSEFPKDDPTDLHEQTTMPAGSDEQQEVKDPSSELKKIGQACDIDNLVDSSSSKCVTGHQVKKMDDEAGKGIPFTCKPVFNLHRGMRRRCLVFEMTGAHRKNLNNASDTGPSNILQSDDKQVVPLNLGSDAPRCILPGIGLHLNSLATTSKDHKTNHEITVTESQLKRAPCSTASFDSPSINQEYPTKSLALTCSEQDEDPNENGFHVAEDMLQASAHVAMEELNPSSPKKKRRKFEQAGESEACKRCNCKKSKCLKLYCECFAAGVYCVEPCSCQECFNKPIHEDTVLATRKQIESRNPLAFAPKVIRSSDSIAEIVDEPNNTPASARHKRGCNCKKSSCLKKYCECYQGGVGCSISCRCEGCKNAFGRKDGSPPLGTDADQEEEETETMEKCAVDQRLQKATIQNNEEHNSTLPITPLQICRPSAQLPVSSKRKPPRSSFLAIGSSSVLHNRLGKPNFLAPQPKFEKNFQPVVENEMPNILLGSSSPNSGIKTLSPNSKRVSPPHCDFGSSPNRRTGRKLILRSIPSFPSLTQH